MFEILPNDSRVEPAYGKNIGIYKLELCAPILFKKTPRHLKLWYLFPHSSGLPHTLSYAGLGPGDLGESAEPVQR